MTGPVVAAIATEDERSGAWVARGIARDKQRRTTTIRIALFVAAAALALGLIAKFV